ncbi:hypothetical protein ASE63_08365 [Bosea sp. Root381]|nr:hypothetical protein ASE63_08365 [Bosea sp. Root381]
MVQLSAPQCEAIMDRPENLLALADRCEGTAKPDRALDADIYEALGYNVRRKPKHLVSRNAPMGGIYQQGELWKALGAVSANIDVAARLLRQKAPGWSWSLQCVAGDEEAGFQALVAECSGNGAIGSLALCAAMLRAFARSDLACRAGALLKQK